MTVTMTVDPGTTIPHDAEAEILQSALLTDRFVQLGPTYTGGPLLASGAHIDAQHTRSPISIDDIGKAIDQLVVALDRTGPGGPHGKDIGDLLHVSAQSLDGNGAKIRSLLASSRDALAAINTKAPDLQAVVKNLDVLSTALADRDTLLRRFTHNLSDVSGVVAAQSGSLSDTLASLNRLTTQVADFVQHNRSLLKSDLGDTATVARTIESQEQTLARIFDYLPTGAQNLWQAYDPKLQTMRVQIAARDSVIFSDLVRGETCESLLGPICHTITNGAGTGLLDILLDTLTDHIPQGL
jgi:phospholipid/cholesterol/gamma-HCH transport system substrate-binding protein